MSVRKLIEKAERSGIKEGRSESFTIGDSRLTCT